MGTSVTSRVRLSSVVFQCTPRTLCSPWRGFCETWSVLGPGDNVINTYIARDRFPTSCGYDIECLLKWWLMVALSKKGLDETLKTTRVNLNILTSGCFLVTSSNHKMSLSFSLIDTIKKAFSMSAVKAILCILNLGRMSKIFWSNFSPVSKQSLSEGPVDFVEASYMILSLVISLSCRKQHGAAGSVHCRPRSILGPQQAVRFLVGLGSR